jgi:hypothetical protein
MVTGRTAKESHMSKRIAILAAAATLVLMVPVATTDQAFARDKAKSTEGNPTSNRTPERMTTNPSSQVDTTTEGRTSDRTPPANGAASGEQGMEPGSQSQMQAWDQTYQSDRAQEKQLKAGGGSK